LITDLGGHEFLTTPEINPKIETIVIDCEIYANKAFESPIETVPESEATVAGSGSDPPAESGRPTSGTINERPSAEATTKMEAKTAAETDQASLSELSSERVTVGEREEEVTPGPDSLVIAIVAGVLGLLLLAATICLLLWCLLWRKGVDDEDHVADEMVLLTAPLTTSSDVENSHNSADGIPSGFPNLDGIEDADRFVAIGEGSDLDSDGLARSAGLDDEGRIITGTIGVDIEEVKAMGRRKSGQSPAFSEEWTPRPPPEPPKAVTGKASKEKSHVSRRGRNRGAGEEKGPGKRDAASSSSDEEPQGQEKEGNVDGAGSDVEDDSLS
jgi:hypothetical protein